MKLKVSSCQLKIEDDIDITFQKALGLLNRASKNGARLIVLPELFPYGPVFEKEKAYEFWERTPSILEELRAFSMDKRVFIACGLLSGSGDNGLFNSQFFISPDGKVFRYDKINLFPPFKEDKVFLKGNTPKIFSMKTENGPLSLGAMICFDLRFSELSRYYSFLGVNVLLLSSLWPSSRISNFRTLLRARAMENQCFLIASNAYGKKGDINFGGASAIIGPDGNVLIEAGEEEGIIVSEMDTRRQEDVRNFFNSSRPPGSWFFDPEKKVLGLNELKEIVAMRKRAGQRMVFTNGCFDILHAGHISYLKEARSLGDFLVVGLNSDESIRRIKGKKRPVISEEQRSLVLSSLSFVDYVVIFNEDTPRKLIHTLSPDILVKGADWEEEDIVGARFVKEHGGEVKRIHFKVDISTTKIIEKIARSF